MEHFYQSVCLLTSMYFTWILTMTSPSKASSQGHHLTSSGSNGSQLTLTSLLSVPSLVGGQKVDKCCHTGCCLNGGVCFPSSDFCQCPKQFYGYRCEKRRMRLCGSVKHLQWAKIGCNLCRCFDSRLLCMSHIYSGCDGKPSKEEVDLNDYKDDIKIFPMNEASSNAIDNDYSSSNTGSNMQDSNSSDSKTPSETLSSRSAYSDFYYYNYDDEDEENNDNISNKSNPFSNIRTLTFRGYFWTCLVCLVTCFMNWIVDFNTDIYFVS